MNKTQHNIYIGFFIIVTVLVIILLIYQGYTYYTTPLEERFFTAEHNTLRPTGFIGHGLGIIGSILMISGVMIYMIRKRTKRFMRIGLLKHWLELHIFLCTIGPIMILFHTAFKFGGIVAVSFWSMVAVFVSGIIGRFIYIRIPRTIEGKEMSMQQISTINQNLTLKLVSEYNLGNEELKELEFFTTINEDEGSFKNLLLTLVPNYMKNRRRMIQISNRLKKNNISPSNIRSIKRIIKEKIAISNKIHHLKLMQNLFKYWHIAHLPFAIIMLIIMFIHIIVTVSLGYKWIF